MKKGLSKILSLACVFALLLTMMVPAFAAITDSKDDWNDAAVTTAQKDAALYASGTTWQALGSDFVSASNGTDPLVAPVLLKKAAASDAGVYAVFVKEGGNVRVRTIKEVTMWSKSTQTYVVTQKADKSGYEWTKKKDSEGNVVAPVVEYTTTAPADGALTSDTAPTTPAPAAGNVGTEQDVVFYSGDKDNGTPVLNFANGAYIYEDNYAGHIVVTADSGGDKTVAADTYLVDGEGNLILGDDKGYYSDTDANGNTRLWKTTAVVAEGTTRKDAALAAPANFKFTDVTEAEAGKTYTAKDGVVKVLGADGKETPVEGKFYYTLAGTTASAFGKTDAGSQKEGYQKDGKAFGGIVVTPAKEDAYGNPVEAVVDAYKFVDGVPYSQKITTLTDGILTVKTTYDAKTKKAGGEVNYLVVNGKIVIEGDSDGKYDIKTVNKTTRYLLNEDGTVRTNKIAAQDKVKNAPPFYSTAPAIGNNLVKVDNKKFDPYEDVEIEIDGVAQRYCLDKTGKVLVNDYRRLIDENGNDLGVAYYTSDGITYAGWVEGDKAYKYQTNVEGRYIIVTGLQLIPEGVDPKDKDVTIKENYYLFDANGSQIKTNTAKLDGHTFKLKDGVVTEIDGHEPTEADIFTAK